MFSSIWEKSECSALNFPIAISEPSLTRSSHGMAPRIISRHDLTKVLYDTLPAESQSRMLPNKRVATITTTATGVEVACRDGTTYTGSILVGADGAHSLIRDQMRGLALQDDATPAEAVNPEHPFLTTYNAMWIRFPTTQGLKPGDAGETHGTDAAIQLFAGEDSAVVGIYARLPEPTEERIRWTAQDEARFVERWGHLRVSDGWTVKDTYEQRIGAGLVSLEEGVVPHWSWNRIVLAGDAAHKFTPSTAAGCNNGILDVVVLANELHRMVEASAAGGRADPSAAEIEAAFGGGPERGEPRHRRGDVARGRESVRRLARHGARRGAEDFPEDGGAGDFEDASLGLCRGNRGDERPRSVGAEDPAAECDGAVKTCMRKRRFGCDYIGGRGVRLCFDLFGMEIPG
jgi:2-polyprenyl-6-methoxyphenol hydroxylase-like FAD-dependent oxidoreductase